MKFASCQMYNLSKMIDNEQQQQQKQKHLTSLHSHKDSKITNTGGHVALGGGGGHLLTTPFHLSKQQSISEIAPESQRSLSQNLMRGSLENIYGFVLSNNAGTTNDSNQRLNFNYQIQQSAMSGYGGDSNNMINGSKQMNFRGGVLANTTTTDFFTEEDDILHAQLKLTSPFKGESAIKQQFLRREPDCTAVGYSVCYDEGCPQHEIGYAQEDEQQSMWECASAAASSSSTLVVWGRNQMGQLGLDPQSQGVIKFPMMLPLSLLSKSFSRVNSIFEVKQIACGKAHSVLLVEISGCSSTNLCVFALGSNNQGQLGIGKNIQYSVEPLPVEDLMTQCVKKVSCAKNSTFAITQRGELYSWGSNKDGILGRGLIKGETCSPSIKNQYSPFCIVGKSVDGDYLQALDISAGKGHAGGIFSKGLGADDAIEETFLYTWGSNKYGQLGLGNYESRSSPTEAQTNLLESNDESLLTVSVKGYQPQLLAFGDTFSLVKTFNGSILSSGCNLQGQLGLGSSASNKFNRFQKINSALNCEDGIEKLQANDFSSYLTKSGELYLWGPTPLGQFNSPQSLSSLISKREDRKLVIKDVSLGQSYGLVQDANMQCYQIGSLFHENPRTFDSALSAQIANFSQVRGGPWNFDNFACGHDFVVASTMQSQSEMIFPMQQQHYHQQNSSSIQKQRISRSLTGIANNHKNSANRQNPLIQTSIDITNIAKMNQHHGRYAAGAGVSGTQNHHNNFHQSICSSSLSPLRSSLILVECQSSRRNNNETLNRSAMLSMVQNSGNCQQLKQHRDNCTPMKEFALQIVGGGSQVMHPSNLDQQPQSSSILQDTPVQDRHLHHEIIMMQEQAENQQYSTIQDESRQIEYSSSKFDLPQLLKTPQHPLALQGYQPQSKSNFQHPKIPPFNLAASLAATSTSTSNIFVQQQVDHQQPTMLNASQVLVEVLIREKQELQHSLSIEIQKRLLAEKDLEQAKAGLQPSTEQTLLKQEIAKLAEENRGLIAKLKEAEACTVSQRTEIEALEAKSRTQMAEIEALKNTLPPQARESQDQPEEVRKKNKEIYDLTVQMGSLKEENQSLKRDQEDMKRDFEERLANQQERAQDDYSQLMQEYQMYQQVTGGSLESNKEPSTLVEDLRFQNAEQATRIAELEDQLKKAQGEGIPQKVAKPNFGVRSKKVPSNRFENFQQHNEHSFAEPLSHYTSVGAGVKESENIAAKKQQDNSFTSIQSRRKNQMKRDLSISKISEKSQKPLTIVGQESASVTLEGTQRLFNPIETPNDSQQTPTALAFGAGNQGQQEQKKPAAKSVSSVGSHQNHLFRKHAPMINHQPVLMSQTIDANRSTTNRDQGVLQINKSLKSGVVLQNPPNPYESQDSTSQKISATKKLPSNRLISQKNQQSVKENKAIMTNNKHTISIQLKTPTRQPLARSDLSMQQLGTHVVANPVSGTKPINKHSNCYALNKSPNSQLILNAVGTGGRSTLMQHNHSKKHSLKSGKSASIPPSNVSLGGGGGNGFHLNLEDDSIFDPQLSTQLDESTRRIGSASGEINRRHPKRASVHHHSMLIPSSGGGAGGNQDIPLDCLESETTGPILGIRKQSSSPSTPKMPCSDEMKEQKRLAYQSTPNKDSTSMGGGGQRAQLSANNPSQKNGSTSSNSTLGCSVIMSEMRIKLIDIQNNKQYIEQKIQEYEKKLQLLKGPTSLISGGGMIQNGQNNNSSFYIDLPLARQQRENYGQYFIQQNQQLQKSNSGLLVLGVGNGSTHQNQNTTHSSSRR